MQQDMEKKLCKIVIPRVYLGRFNMYMHRNNAAYFINSRGKPEAYLVA